MKIVYYFYSSYSGTMLGILLDEAKKMALKPDNEVYFVMCEGLLDTCIANPTGNKAVCELCISKSTRILQSQLGNLVTVLHIKDYYKDEYNELLKFDYSTASGFKETTFRDIPIGYASLSSYVQLTRNHKPEITYESRKYLDTLLEQAARLTMAFENIITEIKPDLVCTFNGRFNEVRPVFEVAKKMSIDFKLYEMVPEFDGTYNKVVFDNVMPHAVKANLWRVDECWNNPDLESDENWKLGESFFLKRRNGVVAGDRVYIGNQSKGLLPDNWDDSKKNIAIFNNSEDEWIAVGGEWTSLSLYPSQFDGLKSLFKAFKDDTSKHFYLRVHPNLASVKYKYHMDLYDFEEMYDNVTVIKPDDAISTYDLMENSDTVLVFGSTMGLESAYWKKPVILLCCCMYYYADACYTPQTESEFFDLLNSDLESKYNDNVIKYGLFYHNKKPTYTEKDTQFKFIDFNPVEYSIFGKKIFGYNYQKLFGSVFLMGIYTNLMKLIRLKLFKDRFAIPLADEKD